MWRQREWRMPGQKPGTVCDFLGAVCGTVWGNLLEWRLYGGLPREQKEAREGQGQGGGFLMEGGGRPAAAMAVGTPVAG